MRECFLCGRNGSSDPLDRHHVFGGGLRKKSEKYGLVVDLCHHECHEYGPRAAHQCAETRNELQRRAQKKVMREQGWDVNKFVWEFGKNYLSDEENAELEKNEQDEPEGVFCILDAALLPY